MKAHNIIRHVARLYSYATANKTVEEVEQLNFEKLIAKEEEWEKAFEDYEESDVIAAINNFWQYNSDKSRPNVAQIKSKLEATKTPKAPPQAQKEVKNYCIEAMYMERDMKANKCKKNIRDYYSVVNYILNHQLKDALGYEYKYLEDEDEAIARHKKYEKALALGLFNEFDSLLERSDELVGHY